MNMLHWHLIDDAGWRIEIKKYPKLTEIGSFARVEKQTRWCLGSRLKRNVDFKKIIGLLFF